MNSYANKSGLLEGNDSVCTEYDSFLPGQGIVLD